MVVVVAGRGESLPVSVLQGDQLEACLGKVSSPRKYEGMLRFTEKISHGSPLNLHIPFRVNSQLTI